MSIHCEAHLIYGVNLTEEEVARCRELPEWDDLYDQWGHTADLIGPTCDDTIIFGIHEDGAYEGEISELGSVIHDPRSHEIDALLEVLDTLGIDRDPCWYITCSIG